MSLNNIDNNNNNNNDNKSNDLIDYLIKKLESRLKGLNKKKEIFYNINTIENFLLNKNIFLKLFSDLFEDIQQAVCAIKTLYLENKILNQENLNNKQYLNEVKKKDYWNNLSRTPNKTNFNNNYNFLDNINNNNNNYNFKYENLTEESNNNNYNNKLENVPDIMKNIQENKQKIKEKINNHFNSYNFNYGNNLNDINNNNNFINTNSNINTNYNNPLTDNNNINNNYLKNNKFNYNNDFIQNIKRYLPNYKQNTFSSQKNLNERPRSNSQRKTNSKMPLRIGIQSTINKTNNSKNKKPKKLNKSFDKTSNTNLYRNSGKILPAFEYTLRNYPRENQSKNISKQFINYTNPYPNYFSSFDYLH
jgi:hypothetical protein